MNLLTGVGAAGALVKHATSFVQALKQPKITDEAFSDILKAQIETATSPEARRAKAAGASEEFISRRDVDGDGALRFDESGLDRAVFERLDRNRDGSITVGEYQQALLDESGSPAK